MDAISFINYTFTYPGASSPALRGVTASVAPGEFVLLCGSTGSGKTTLLRSAKPELAPVGVRGGEVLLGGRRGEAPGAGEIGFVGQNPENQLVMDTVEGELAFGLENLALPAGTIRRRVAEIASFFDIGPWMRRRTQSLSGGQKQLLNLAAVLAMQPQTLLLDEPTSQLDPVSSKTFLQMLRRISGELAITVLLSEHRLEDALPLADRVLWMERGEIAACCRPPEFVRRVFSLHSPFAAALPAPARVAHRLGERGAYPLEVRAGREWLSRRAAPVRRVPPAPPAAAGDAVLSARGVWFRYSRDAEYAVRDLSLEVPRGALHAIVGGNGSGKSTLLRLLCGALRPARGKIAAAPGARLSLLPQDPRALFTCDTVRDELLEPPTAPAPTEAEAAAMLARFGLSALAGRHPYDLSGGEMQKAALCKLLLRRPDVLLLDEPAKGVDAAAKRELAALLRALCREGRTVVLVTHDVEFAACCADRCSMLFEGSVVCTGGGRDFFASNLFYTTGTNRMLRDVSPGCVTVEDVEGEVPRDEPPAENL